MERFQGLCDAKTGHDPFKPLGTRTNLNFLHHILCGSLLILIGLLNVLSIIVKVIALPVCYLIGLDGAQLNYEITKWCLWRPLACAIGIVPRMTQNMLSEAEEPSCSSALNKLKQGDIIFANLTSLSDIIYWVLSSRPRPTFVFGYRKGGYVLVDSLFKALIFSCDIQIEGLEKCEEFRSENKQIDNDTCYFSGLGPLMSYLMKNDNSGPVIILPQPQASNGSAILPWATNFEKSYSRKMENDFIYIVKHYGDELSVASRKNNPDSCRRLFLSVTVFLDGGSCNRPSSFPNTVDSAYDYIVRQTLLGSGTYNTTLVNLDEVSNRIKGVETLDEFETVVGDVQIEAYRRCYNEYHSDGAPLVSAGLKLHRCKDVNHDSGQKYKDLYMNPNDET